MNEKKASSHNRKKREFLKINFNTCRDANLNDLRTLRTVDAFVRTSDGNRKHKLHRAAESGEVEIVKYLIQNGDLVNAVNRMKWTALHWVAIKGHVDVANVLIQNGADVNAVDEDKCTALHRAAWYGSFHVVKMLLEVGTDVNAADKYKWTALHFAVQDGHVDVAKVLIQNGADVNAVNKRKETALHWAALRGRTNVVKLLIRNGADVNGLHYRVKNLCLRLAALCRDVDVVKVLIQNGADVNAAADFNKKRTALHNAASKGRVDVVKVLIQNGADVNAVDEDKKTALHFAARRVDVVKVLIQNGADVNVLRDLDDTDKYWCLRLASEYGYVYLVKVLLQNGADVNAVDEENFRVLSTAAKEDDSKCVLLLLCFGAKIDEHAIANDLTGLLEPINDRMNLLRAGNSMGTSLMSDEERRFMWNLAFSFTIQHRVAAFKAYYAIRSFITFNGIFMGPGYELGEESIWRQGEEEEEG